MAPGLKRRCVSRPRFSEFIFFIDAPLPSSQGEGIRKNFWTVHYLEFSIMNGKNGDPGAALNEFVAIVRRLRGPGGCPWDAQQTPETLKTYRAGRGL